MGLDVEIGGVGMGLARSEMKRLERESKKSKIMYAYTNEQMLEIEKRIKEEVYQQIKTRITATIMTNTLSACMYLLVETEGYGKKRLENYIDKFNNEFKAIREGYVTLQDWQKVLQEKGIDVVKLFSNLLKNHDGDNNI